MRSRLTAESPEDLWGPLVPCPECGAELWEDWDDHCDECGFDPSDDFEPPEPEYDDYPVGYDGTGRW